MSSSAQQASTLEPFGPNDHARLNDLVANISSLEPKHAQFVQDLDGKRDQYKHPKLTPKQRGYLTGLHDNLVTLGVVDAVGNA